MSITSIATYTITFLAVYVQVFILITFFERRKDLREQTSDKRLPITHFPSVTIIMPCWNESKTVHGTVESLLALDYPKEKLFITIIDDGSTDNTWEEMQKYQGHPQISLYHTENGGKHVAVNFGIDKATTDLIGCLDADSFVAPHALTDMVRIFNNRPDVMAVAPTLIVHGPKNILQWAQKVEYNMSVYLKKMQAFMNAIHVTPGPFSVFRREVFERIGKFKKAHGTEDQEIAYRMQENHMKIEHCPTAYVYTVTPDTVKKLYTQRLRWIYGFIQNTIDYRRLILNPKYGNFSLFTVPAGVISITATVYLFAAATYNVIVYIAETVTRWSIVGFTNTLPRFEFDWLYINTKALGMVTIVLYSLVLISMIVGSRIAKQKLSWHIISFMLIYSVIAPFWLMRAVWNSITSSQPKWR
ncbi:MAG TPA: glycosyltransferase [Candidatus Paceibacterota bacterium]